MQKKMFGLLGGVSMAVLLTACGSQGGAIGFDQDVKPILDQHCAECHRSGGDGAEKSGFLVDSYQAVMAGTKLGPVVVAGDALSSSLYRLVAGKVDASIRMPHNKSSLSSDQIATIEKWIEQGAKQ